MPYVPPSESDQDPSSSSSADPTADSSSSDPRIADRPPSDPNDQSSCDAIALGALARKVREQAFFPTVEKLREVTWIPLGRLRGFEAGEIRLSPLEFVEWFRR